MDRKPSSGREGFLQSVPRIPNQFLNDESLHRVTNLFLPNDVQDDASPDLKRFGDAVLSEKVMDWISDAERNPPYLRGSGYNSFGDRTDQLVTSEGWRCLQDMGFLEGIVANAYDLPYGEYSRVVQFIKYHIWSASNANVACPSAMQDGAAAVLKDQLSRGGYDSETCEVLQEALRRLTSRDPAVGWTSGQWMTERKGGSNVSGTETLATYVGPTRVKSAEGLSLGPWSIDGFKWFSSATDCSMAILLAQTAKGLSCFFAPTRQAVDGQGQMNGIRIQRLKSKMGTRPLPTAELELSGMKACLLGKEGEGVKVISGMLNITRVHNSVTAVGVLGRGLAIARAYALERRVGDRLLKDIFLFRKTLAKQFQGYRANMLLAYFVVYLLGLSENTSPHSFNSTFASQLRPRSIQQTHALLRVLTPVTKALTAKASIFGLQEAIEALGGVGYLENEESQSINIARLFRDTNVLSIWEGTTDVMATDTVKVLRRRDSGTILNAISDWISHALLLSHHAFIHLESVKEIVHSTWQTFKHRVSTTSLDELTANGREVMTQLGDIVCCVLLVIDATSADNEASKEICLRFAEDRFGLRRPHRDWKTISRLDGLIAFGQDHDEAMSSL